jgi:hypothetical protein
MTQKSTTKPDDPAQSKRFIDMAREIGVDERPEAFDKAFERVVKPAKRVISKRSKGSDA